MAKKDKEARKAERKAKQQARKSARADKKSGRKAKRQAKKETKATKKDERKTARQERKAAKQTEKTERKAARQEARAERKANGGGFVANFVDSDGFATAKNVAQNVINRNNNQIEEEFKMSDRTTEATDTTEETSFYEEHKTAIWIAGGVTLAATLLYVFRDNIFGGGKTDGVGYIEPIDLS